jgi:hypothetical protein
MKESNSEKITYDLEGLKYRVIQLTHLTLWQYKRIIALEKAVIQGDVVYEIKDEVPPGNLPSDILMTGPEVEPLAAIAIAMDGIEQPPLVWIQKREVLREEDPKALINLDKRISRIARIITSLFSFLFLTTTLEEKPLDSPKRKQGPKKEGELADPDL